jgi:hypothetical protein
MNNTNPEPEPLMSPDDLAKYLNVTTVAVYLAIKAGRIPPPIYPLLRSPRWRRTEVDAFLEKTRATPTQARVARRQALLEKLKTGTSP